jgi:hypothetical protein
MHAFGTIPFDAGGQQEAEPVVHEVSARVIIPPCQFSWPVATLTAD